MNNNFFTKQNYIGMLISVGLLILGYWCLAQAPVDGMLTMNVAPIILTLTYCVVIPVAILWGRGKKKN